MLSVHQLTKSFGVQPLFEDVSFTLNDGDRVGLIGPNASGKTTLLEILAGRLSPDRGTVSLQKGVTVGYLSQGFTIAPNQSLGTVLAVSSPNPERLQTTIAQLAGALGEEPHNHRLQAAYDRALARLIAADPGRAAALLATLGLDDIPEQRLVGQLSGGQKTRLSLALIILRNPDLLLLDEPTNHLDIPMLEWLEAWLASFSGGVLLVSHDRTFLDRTVNRILAIDDLTQRLVAYADNYTGYLEQYLLEREKQWDRFRDQRAEIRRMRQDIARVKQQAQHSEAGTTDSKVRRYAKKMARKAKSRERKLERYLASAERVEKPGRSWQMKLEFGKPDYLGREVLSLHNVAVGYPGSPPLLAGLNQRVQGGQRIVLTGANGSGKTTLLRTIAGQLPAQQGTLRLGRSVKLGFMTQEQARLDPRLSALEMVQQAAPLNETEARSFLHYFLFSGDEPLRPSSELSYGERARLALGSLVVRGCTFLLLDEPLNHLDIPSRTRFEQALAQFEGTVLAVVHDRYFIDAFASDVWDVRNRGIAHEIRTPRLR